MNGFILLLKRGLVLMGISGTVQGEKNNNISNSLIRSNENNNITTKNNSYSDNKISQISNDKQENLTAEKNINAEDKIYSSINDNSVFQNQNNNLLISETIKKNNDNLSENDLKLDQMIKNSNKNSSLNYGVEYFLMIGINLTKVKMTKMINISM